MNNPFSIFQNRFSPKYYKHRQFYSHKSTNFKRICIVTINEYSNLNKNNRLKINSPKASPKIPTQIFTSLMTSKGKIVPTCDFQYEFIFIQICSQEFRILFWRVPTLEEHSTVHEEERTTSLPLSNPSWFVFNCHKFK